VKENLALVPIAPLACHETGCFEAIDDIRDRCLAELEFRRDRAWSRLAALSYLLQNQNLRRRQPGGHGKFAPPLVGRTENAPNGAQRLVGNLLFHFRRPSARIAGMTIGSAPCWQARQKLLKLKYFLGFSTGLGAAARMGSLKSRDKSLS
jgi:hypothetical protein